tara:strand:+ start:893 stop:1132 length:240 start_codon:yes stop_codon:yes gene_type:complete
MSYFLRFLITKMGNLKTIYNPVPAKTGLIDSEKKLEEKDAAYAREKSTLTPLTQRLNYKSLELIYIRNINIADSGVVLA